MNLLAYGRIAGRNLLRARRRTLLLSAALGIVTAFLVFLLSMSQGITENMIRSATTLAAGHVNVAGFYKTRPTDAIPIVVDVERVKALVTSTIPADKLDFVIDRQRGFGKLVSDKGSIITGLAGIDPTLEKNLRTELNVSRERDYVTEGGREARVGSLEQVGQPGTITLFADQARRLKVVPGDQVTVVTGTFGGATNSKELVVAGVAENIGFLSSWTSFMARGDVQSLYALKPDTTGAVMIYLKKLEDVQPVMRDLRAAFEKGGWTMMPHDDKSFWMKFPQVSGEDWTGQHLDVNSWEDEVSFLKWVVLGFNVISFILVLILGLIIVVGIMNTMWISVRERTGEIGTLRAIGMQRSVVLRLFLFEALLLGLAATSVGALVGAGVSYLVNAAHVPLPYDALRGFLLSSTLHLSTGPLHVLAAIATFTVVTGLAAVWPSFQAARMRPVRAMQAP